MKFKEDYMKKGFTLVEVLVAIFIFVLILISAYQVYERSQKTYILGEQLADLQQNLRFAYEQISYDLRVAGYNVYPDDEATRPDEQLEGIWRGAIAIRADFDNRPAGDEYTCEDSDNNRMCDSGTGNFLSVSTDNSEIRIYALAKKPNDPNGETISFLADLSKPRNARVGEISNLETIEIKGVAINQTNPPYTLYRITIDPNANITNGQKVPQSALVWTPLASNIYSMQFTYYNENGVAQSYIVPPDENNIVSKENTYLRKHGFPFGSTPSGFAKYIQFTLKGVTQNPDPRWVDSKDPYQATKNKRKIDLSSTIVLKNVGVAPHELADTVSPDAPTDLVFVDGYCNGVLLTWKPSLALDVTAYYIQVVGENLYSNWGNSFKYNCDDWPTSCYIISTPEVHIGGRVGFYVPNLTYGIRHYARVFSQDRAGNLSLDATNTVNFIINPNPIKPKKPEFSSEFIEDYDTLTNLKRLFVPIIPPTGYDETQPTTCKNPPAVEDAYFSSKTRDLYGYRLYHKRFTTTSASDFTPDIKGLVATEKEPTALPFTSDRSNYPDIKACPCEYYAYKANSVTSCATLTGSFGKSGCTGLFVSDFSQVTKEGENPKAFLVPEHQNFDNFPRVVPGKPGSLTALAPEISPATYSVTLNIPVNLALAKLNEDGTYVDYPEGGQMDVWRFKIYKYNTEQDANENKNGQEILDTNISGVGDAEDWDAGIDGGKEYVQDETVSFNIGNFNIPSGQRLFFRARGYYKCTGGDYLGQLSDPVSIPCNITWSPNITNPPFDYATISQTVFPITFQATGLSSSDVPLTVTFTIPTPYNEQFTGTCNTYPTCNVIFNWNNTAYSDGTYQVNALAIDAKGCSGSTTRFITLNRNCGDTIIQGATILNDELTFELQRINTSDYLLLQGISFNSTNNYLYSSIKFSENSGFSSPFTLWESATPQDMRTKWIGKDYPYPFTQNNWCGYLKLYPDPDNSTKRNYFRLKFNKNIDTTNGPLNLVGSFHYKKCDGIQEHPYNLSKKASLTVVVGKIICSYTNTVYTRSPSITVDYCLGQITLYCPTSGSGNCEGKITAFYPESSLQCIDVPIYPGP